MTLPSAESAASAVGHGPSARSGFATDIGAKLDAAVRSGLLSGLHAVLVSCENRLVVERYYPGADESWGRPLGIVAFRPDTLHDLRSVTKSVVGLLYGIALDRRLVPPPDAPLLAQFPEYPDLAADPARRALTIAHALTMTMGLAWDESRSYADPTNSERAMEDAPDRNRFVLAQPVEAAPGTKWTYSGGAVALLGALIARGTGARLEDFARNALFAPLGITQFEWARGRDGVAAAASGLRLLPRDLLRIGIVVQDRGCAGSRQVVSAEWLDASFTPVIETNSSINGVRYGRLWYIGQSEVGTNAAPMRWFAGFGNGGQRLWIMPHLSLAAVILCGNYNAPDQAVAPLRVWREIVLANLRPV